MRTMIYQVIGRETIDDVSAAVGFDSTKIPDAERRTIYALVQAVGGDVRYCIDGTDDPTLTLGMRLLEDATMEVWGAKALKDFKALDDGGTATLEVIFMGRGGLG